VPLSQIDSNTALIVVDLQKGIVGLPLVDPIAPVIERTQELLTAFRSRKLPVVLVNVAGAAPGRTEQPRPNYAFPPNWTELIPELGAQETDLLITKRSWGAFTNTSLETELKRRGVTQVVVTGVATGTGVEATARQAYELGFNVTLPLDAMTDARPDAQEYSRTHIFPRLGETGSTQDVLNLLAQRIDAE
jgi:nicotinamidase-related amidase